MLLANAAPVVAGAEASSAMAVSKELPEGMMGASDGDTSWIEGGLLDSGVTAAGAAVGSEGS